MDALSQLVSGLSPSQMDEAMKLLQRLSASAAPPAATDGAPLEGTAATAAAVPIKKEEEPSPPSVNVDDEDDIPLAMLSFSTSPSHIKQEEDDACDARQQQQPPKRPRRKKPSPTTGSVPGETNAAPPSETPQDTASAIPEEQPQQQQPTQPVKRAAKKMVASSAPPSRSLATFGFVSAAKTTDGNRNKLFAPFVQDKRLVPKALRFWELDGSQEENNNNTNSNADDKPAAGSIEQCAGLAEEESSLLHPPLSGQEVVVVPDKQKASFTDLIESATNMRAAAAASLGQFPPAAGSSNNNNNSKALHCACPFHCLTTNPYPGFDNEVIFCGFYAIGYDPCQARPAYFGTYSHLQDGNLNDRELLQMARYARAEQMPRLSTLDYEYDSGDDWDVLEGEDVCATSSLDSSDEDASIGSSDLDFINDDDDESDSDCELQRKMMEARQRRINRLRGKDKLIPSYSGPFVGIAAVDHPLRGYDQLQRVLPLTGASIEAMLAAELEAAAHAGLCSEDGDLTDAQLEARRSQKLVEAALKNRREMTSEELDALHQLIALNSKLSGKMLVEALKEQHMCAGVAIAEIERTVKRFYARSHGILVRRDVPWQATDERLFNKSIKKKPAAPSTAAPTTNDSTQAAEKEDDGEEEEGDAVEDDNEEGVVVVVGHAIAAPDAEAEAAPSIQREGSLKRSREETLQDGIEMGDITEAS